MATKKQVLEEVLRGEGCLGKCADDEPVFVVCGRDSLALQTLERWIDLAEVRGVSHEKVARAKRDRRAFLEWSDLHGTRLPD